MEMKKSLKIVFSVILSDAGEATRSIEIADGIRSLCPEDYELDMIFLSTGSTFEEKVISNGFKIHKCSPSLPGVGFREDFKTTETNIIGDVQLAAELLRGEIDAFKELKPDIVIYGFNPIAGLARRMVGKPIPGICYMPTPFQKDVYLTTLMKDVPDNIKFLTYLPLSFRKAIMRSIPKSLKIRVPAFVQSNIIEALKEFKWEGEPVKTLFDMLKADLTIINDFEDFNKDHKLPQNFKVVGPLYAPSANDAQVDDNILKIFNRENKRLKIFCTLGSSGDKEYLLEAIKALTQGIGKEWSAVILAPPCVCQINEAKECARGSSNVYITDKFVPAPLVNGLADVVISHGGQGTVQTAIASCTPIVGFAMQPEQQINLDNVAMRGAGIRIPKHRWNVDNIQSAVKTIIKEPSYKENMKVLKKALQSTDGKKNSAQAIWKYILDEL
ncbi:glycosyltransferase [Clostridium saccharobutylicum]|uniref:PGL/p-HBAD biosynthesis glycosyltransferasec n=1 Tax=Clostridium saccharobutylicum TaxID=169679 RepID=A0A1S8NHX3_CLOSA|nr:nucleotide disphospho-sugar-binding domain-containing protein [Clostridium saccharobutylicum]OOM16079.1 PGL/p-HBAD biosynthesis glycosyltransferasec [Clostridium saccharobutylicum]